MAAEPEVLDELHRLRARVPQLTGALAASADGLVLAHDTPGVEPDGLAALTAAALGVAIRMADATGQGDLRELLVRGVNGYVATYAAGGSAVLTLLAQDRVNVGSTASGGAALRHPDRGAGRRRRRTRRTARRPGQAGPETLTGHAAPPSARHDTRPAHDHTRHQPPQHIRELRRSTTS